MKECIFHLIHKFFFFKYRLVFKDRIQVVSVSEK